MPGERLSAHRFSGVREQPPTARVVKEFSWRKGTGLLVGLEEAEGSVLCLYEPGTSGVVKAVVLPGRAGAFSGEKRSFSVARCCTMPFREQLWSVTVSGGVFPVLRHHAVTAESPVESTLMYSGGLKGTVIFGVC